MLKMAVTGGIATGKSAFCQAFLEACPNTFFFDCDQYARQLLTENVDTIQAVVDLFGIEAKLPQNGINRLYVRNRIFVDASLKRKLEDIMHPRIWAEYQRLSKKSLTIDKNTFFLADVPLLFETEREKEFDKVLTIATSESCQLHRLMMRGQFSEEEARRMIQSQHSLPYKIAHSDHVFWNDGTLFQLHRQVAQFINLLPYYLPT